MKTLKAFFSKKETLIGIGAALAFQLIFFTVWLTAYDGILDRTNQLKVAVVNEDIGFGKEIAKTVIANPSLTATSSNDLSTAKNELNERKLGMVIHIPDNFSQNLNEGKPANLEFLIDQAAPMLSRQMMEGAAGKLTGTVNEQIAKQMKHKAKSAIIDQATTTEPVAGKVAEQSIETYESALPADPVNMLVRKTNNTEGFSASIIPLMIVLASFVGSMIMSMQLHFATLSLQAQFGKWQLFGTRLFINAIVSISLSVLTLLLIMLFSIELQLGAITVWAFQSLLFFSFLVFCQASIALFGNAGMIVNIIAMATQLVSSGAMVPRELLDNFYKKIGDILPATYGADGYFSAIFGGGIVNKDFNALLLITIILLAITAGATALKKQQKAKSQIDHLSA